MQITLFLIEHDISGSFRFGGRIVFLSFNGTKGIMHFNIILKERLLALRNIFKI